MDNVGPADGGGSKKEEPLFGFPIDEVTEPVGKEGTGKTALRRGREVHWAVADKEIGILFKEGGCVVIRDKHGATVLRITYLKTEDVGLLPTLKVVPYSAGAPENAWRYVRYDV